LGRRSRKRGRTDSPAPRPQRALARGYARGEARREQVRAGLEPLAPGERPTAVTVAAVVALAVAVANVVIYAAGGRVRGASGSAGGVIAFAFLMLVASVGMWQARYWAVLGFQALLAITILIAALSLAVASNVAAVALCLGIILPAGLLFWKLVRAMARLQMPDRGPAQRVR
jgi:hypothetical protein